MPSFLSRLRSRGAYYLIAALILIIGVPIYQWLVLTPSGYGEVLNGAVASRLTVYLSWISQHSSEFLLYRALLIIAFGLLFTLPFTLFRIIVAQELVAQLDEAETIGSEEEDEEDEEAETEDA